MSNFIISADLAQVNDFTAITVLETVGHGSGREHHLRYIERPQRGTSYPQIVERLKEIAHSEQFSRVSKAIVIDITGVGLPVMDLLKRARIGVKLIGISITGGNTVNQDGNIYRVPKHDLVSCTQIAFQEGRLLIADGLPNADILVKELMNFKVKINANGHDQYGAWREGIHDDIVLSAAMGVWCSLFVYAFDVSSLIS